MPLESVAGPLPTPVARPRRACVAVSGKAARVGSARAGVASGCSRSAQARTATGPGWCAVRKGLAGIALRTGRAGAMACRPGAVTTQRMEACTATPARAGIVAHSASSMATTAFAAAGAGCRRSVFGHRHRTSRWCSENDLVVT